MPPDLLGSLGLTVKFIVWKKSRNSVPSGEWRPYFQEKSGLMAVFSVLHLIPVNARNTRLSY